MIEDEVIVNILKPPEPAVGGMKTFVQVPAGRWLLRVQLIAAVADSFELKLIEAPILSIEPLDGESSDLIWQLPGLPAIVRAGVYSVLFRPPACIPQGQEVQIRFLIEPWSLLEHMAAVAAGTD